MLIETMIFHSSN